MRLSSSTEKGLEKHIFTAGRVLKTAAYDFCSFKRVSHSGIQGTGCGVLTHWNKCEKIANLVGNGNCDTWKFPKTLEKVLNISPEITSGSGASVNIRCMDLTLP